MLSVAKRVYHQFYYRREADPPASWLHKRLLAWRYDCYVSPRAHIYFASKIRLAPDVRIHDHAMLGFRSGAGSAEYNIEIGAGTKVLPDAKIIPQQGHVRIGKHCTVQYGCLLYGVGGLEIGDDTHIAAKTVIVPMNHIYTDPNTAIWRQGETARGIKIGRDVWLGTGVTVLDGVMIGDGSVVGAGSVVSRDIPPYSIAVGAPARVIKHRGPPQNS
jgi:acetyltransferase-like isoleucine patch superfamily enzyme